MIDEEAVGASNGVDGHSLAEPASSRACGFRIDNFQLQDFNSI
jgi:hypothetical protein